MGWNRIKKMFKKKKKKRDEVIAYEGGMIGLKEITPHELIPDNMRIHTKIIKEISEDLNLYEVNGVMIEAEDILEAQRKYLRKSRS